MICNRLRIGNGEKSIFGYNLKKRRLMKNLSDLFWKNWPKFVKTATFSILKQPRSASVTSKMWYTVQWKSCKIGIVYGALCVRTWNGKRDKNTKKDPVDEICSYSTIFPHYWTHLVKWPYTTKIYVFTALHWIDVRLLTWA